MGLANRILRRKGLGVLLLAAVAASFPAIAGWDDEPDIGAQGGDTSTMTVDTSPGGAPEPGVELAADRRPEEKPAAQSSVWTLLLRLGDRLARPLLAWLAY